jgi:protein ImuA
MTPPNGFQRPDPALLADLRARIARIERQTPESGGSPGALSLGAPELDGALPWGGLPRAALHEVSAGDLAAAAGFCAALSARLAGGRGTVLWCRKRRDPWGRALYGPGLASFGLAPERLIVARGRTETDVLWAMEEGLRSGAPAVVLGEVGGLPPRASRRLQLAAEAGAVTGLLLNGAGGTVAPGPAVTRWRVSTAALTGSGVGEGSRWWVELLRCRGGVQRGAPVAWFVEWRDGTDGTTGRFAVVAALGDRALEPPADADVAARAG